LASGKLLHQLPPGEAEVAGAVSSDGRVVALAEGQDIVLWNATMPQAPGIYLRAHSAPIHNLSLDGEGSVLVSGDAEGTIRVWDLLPADTPSGILAQPRTLAQALAYDGSGNMALRPDGERLAIAAKGSTLDIHDLQTGALLARNEAVHPGYALHHLAYSPDGTILASSSFDKTTALWNAETLASLGPPLEGHEGRVLAAAFSPDGRRLASVSTDNTVRLWDIGPLMGVEGEQAAAARPIGQPLRGHSNWVRSVAFLPDGRGLVSGDSDGNTIVWDTGRMRPLAGHRAQVRGLAFSPNGRTLASGSLDSNLTLWDTATGEPVAPPLTDHPKSVFNLAFSPDGRHLASVGAGRWVILWEQPDELAAGAAAGEPVGYGLDGHTGQVYSVAFSPDGKTLATGSRDRVIILWDVDSREPLGSPLEGHEGWVMGLAWSPDGRTLASASADGTVRLWRAGELLDGTEGHAEPAGPPLVGHGNWVNDLAFSPDGTMLATASSDHTVRLWAPWECMIPEGPGCTGQRMTLTGHTAQVWSVEFLPGSEGQYLVSGGADGSVLVWNLDTGEPVAPPLLGSVEMETMAVSPDGSLLALGALDTSGLVYLWDLDLTPWSDRACAIANRNLTDAEWRQYLGETPYRTTCP
jgi:WD40 repeat protein